MTSPLSPLSVHIANATMRTRRARLKAITWEAATCIAAIILSIIVPIGLAMVFAP